MNKCKKKHLVVTYTILFLFCILSLPEPLHGNTYYVDNLKGRDTNNGSDRSPWLTLKKSVKSVKPGDTVIIVSNGSDYPYREVISLQHSGTSDQWITIRGESPTDKPRIVGNGSNTLLSCYEKSYVKIRDLLFENTSDQGMGFFNCSYIQIYNVEIKNIGKNGILITGGGSHYTIDGSYISNISGSGIGLIGHKSGKLSDTLIQNSKVSDVRGNDGITLHKNSSGFDVGSNHIIRGNDLSNCREQGIDITSGQNIILENNRTSRNGDSGIMVAHNASDVSIKSHFSTDEKQFGIIIGNSKNVFISDSIFINTGSKAAMKIYNKCNGLTVKNNLIKHGPNRSSGALIDIEPTAQDLRFEGNTFSVSKTFRDTIIRYLFSTNPLNTSSVWTGNKWAISSSVDKHIMYSIKDGVLRFDQFKANYAPTDMLAEPLPEVQNFSKEITP